MDIVRFHGRRQRRGAGGRVSYLPGGWDPYRYAGRFQGLLHDPGQFVADLSRSTAFFSRVANAATVCHVIPRAVEPPVHGMLDPDAHRIEQCGGSQCGGSHGNRRTEREHARGQQHEPGVRPDQQSGHDRVGECAGDDPVDVIQPVLQDRYRDAGGQCDVPERTKTVNAALTGSDGVGSRVETGRFTIPPRVKGTDLRHAGSYRVAILPARR